MRAEWLIKGEPRAVQEEYLLRSYYGWRSRDAADDEQNFCRLPDRSGPAIGYGSFLEMRLGKTKAGIAEFALFRRDHGFNRMLVLSPNKFKMDWVEELGNVGLDVLAHGFESSSRAAVSKFLAANRHGGALVVHYEALGSKANLELIQQFLGDRTLIGADESILIKGHNSNTTKAAIALSKECGAKRIYTGKPVTQGAHDLWSQFRFIGEIDKWNFFAWRNSFCKMGGFQGKQILRGEKGIANPERLIEIRERISFSARKADWLKTPGKEYATRVIDYGDEQRRIYREMQNDLITEIRDGIIVKSDQVITKLIKLQQISSGFIIDEEGQVHLLVPHDKNPKVLDIKKMLDEELQSKLIISCVFTHTMDLLGEALKEYEPAFIRGDDWHKANGKTVIEEKARFNADRACRVIIGQSKAMKYGHMLMGNSNDPCLTTLMAENSYSLDDRSQLEERNQGGGQMGVVTIWDYTSTKMDRDIITALQEKEDVSAVVMGYARKQGILPRAD